MDPFESADAKNIIKRHEFTVKFVGDRDLGTVLDIGERNPLTERFEKLKGLKIQNTIGDLDCLTLEGGYDSVFCFEVIEHLMNPLNLLLQIHSVLRPSGRLFLSTPKHKPHFLWGEHHFTEYDEKRLGALIARAGFVIERNAEFRTMPLWWHFLGIRPLIRIFNNSVFITELRKAPR